MNFDRKNLLLYAVTDRSWLRGGTLYDQIEQALRGGVTLLQLRKKNLCRELFLQEAFQIKELCDRYEVPLIINDHVEIARAVDAAGVHVGQKDMEAGAARAILGSEKIIGVSARTVEQALYAERQGADYLGVGAVFSTGTKQDAQNITKNRLCEICRAVSIPVVAIGGITVENMAELGGSGSDGIAGGSAVFAQKKIETAVRELRRRTEQMLQRTE
ncbi:MAG: thiamine phosphate synthase [Clostridiales bacterium]|nr:thiamine phosphate synthase [Clostridiales bacterium]